MPERVFLNSAPTVADALAFVEAEATAAELDAELTDRLLLVAGEAVANVIEHGEADPEVGVRLALRVDEDQVELLVSDSGEGIDPSAFDRAALPPDDALDGRGLYMMKELADDVRLVGRALAFRFRRDAS